MEMSTDLLGRVADAMICHAVCALRDRLLAFSSTQQLFVLRMNAYFLLTDTQRAIYAHLAFEDYNIDALVNQMLSTAASLGFPLDTAFLVFASNPVGLVDLWAAELQQVWTNLLELEQQVDDARAALRAAVRTLREFRRFGRLLRVCV